MRVFLTGATGFIGSRIIPHLIDAGHEVIGMTRSESGAAALRAAGATPFHGVLENPDAIAAEAGEADAVIHTAFDHNMANFLANCEKDSRVIHAIGQTLKGSDRPFMITSGTGIGDPGDGTPAREDVFNPDHPNPRIASEIAANDLLEQGVNMRVMRLPQVHDTERQGLITYLIALVRDSGCVPYIGDGANCWSAAHVSDVARLYAMAFDQGAPGVRYHAVAEGAVPMRDVAEVVAEGLGVPAKSMTAEEAEPYLGWFSAFAGLDMSSDSASTRKAIGWEPTGPGLIEDLRAMDYSRRPAGVEA